MPPRYSRHYYDLYCMSTSWVKDKALSDLDLLSQVVSFKEKFYRSPWAEYEYAKPGTMKLLPPEHCVTDLRNDYKRMQSMIFGEAPIFDDMMVSLINLENEINALR